MVMRSPDRQDVAVEIDGQTHRGSYTVEHDETITVRDARGNRKATHLGALGHVAPGRLARLLLRELVSEGAA